jgi:hypothetical protein
MKLFGMMLLLLLSTAATAWPQQDGFIDDSDVKVVSFKPVGYPAMARLKHEGGAVVVKVTLDDNGKVVKAAPISGTKDLIDLCVDNVKSWEFRPNSEKSAVIVYLFQTEDGICPGGDLRFSYIRPNLAKVSWCPAPPTE